MRSEPQRPLRDALVEFKSAMEDLQRARYQGFESALQRALDFLQRGRPLGDALHAQLPVADFDTWFAAAQQTVGGMIGGGRLAWPASTPQRISLQLTLLQRIADDTIDALSFAREFCYAGTYHDDNIREFQSQILRPFYRDMLRLIAPALSAENPQLVGAPSGHRESSAASSNFVDGTRLAQLRAVTSERVDLRRVIRLCEELNVCYAKECYLAVAMLTRALIDHVPPIFGVTTFDAVANNYRGTRSFRDSMQHLGASARKIGDAHLHVQARARDALPSQVQVNFSQDIDVLLAEIVRLLETEP